MASTTERGSKLVKQADEQITKEVQLAKGDSLVKVANKYLGEYSRWREVAQINGIDIFDGLPTGKNLKIPTREELKKLLDKEKAQVLANAEKDVKARLREISNSREIQSIAKTLGVDTEKLIKDLDLSPLSKKLSEQVNTDDAVDEAWQIIGWIL
ncbi:hypothetical protein CLI64_11035 [Nostoc sp. CENA543]|uniref:hypothetical protein n=1 Tax=Nostoc sp. CENA543 TaxID=1869241 RepID=UPI000CA31732|nr:hypothetical protein [Nostoc sp. CENA543]AUT00888.1 hypothetical protein CLI64_11035 [Nostoc sp. CENA543]